MGDAWGAALRVCACCVHNACKSCQLTATYVTVYMYPHLPAKRSNDNTLTANRRDEFSLVHTPHTASCGAKAPPFRVQRWLGGATASSSCAVLCSWRWCRLPLSGGEREVSGEESCTALNSLLPRPMPGRVRAVSGTQCVGPQESPLATLAPRECARVLYHDRSLARTLLWTVFRSLRYRTLRVRATSRLCWWQPRSRTCVVWKRGP